jgi:hypothetical protein
MGDNESSKSLTARFIKTQRLYCSTIQRRVFSFVLVYRCIVEKCLKFEVTFLVQFKITERRLIVPMRLKPADYWTQVV